MKKSVISSKTVQPYSAVLRSTVRKSQLIVWDKASLYQNCPQQSSSTLAKYVKTFIHTIIVITLFSQQPVTVQNVSILNPVQTKITEISALTDFDFEPIQNPSPSQPAIVYNPYYDDVTYIEITILKTTDNSKPSNVQLSIFGCAQAGSSKTKAQIETTITALNITTSVTLPSNESKTSITTTASTGATTKKCEEMQAIDEQSSRKITVSLNDVPEEEKPQFQPTSNQGVSFPSNDKTPTITVNFGQPAQIQSVSIPRHKTPGANVQQFEVTFYSPNGNKINDKPILSTPSPKDDKTKPAYLDFSQIPSDTPVSRIEIKIVNTTDDQSPKGVVLDIKACTEITTGLSYLYFFTCDIDFVSYCRNYCSYINNNWFTDYHRSN